MGESESYRVLFKPGDRHDAYPPTYQPTNLRPCTFIPHPDPTKLFFLGFFWCDPLKLAMPRFSLTTFNAALRVPFVVAGDQFKEKKRGSGKQRLRKRQCRKLVLQCFS